MARRSEAKPVSATTELKAEFELPYAPGELKAIAFQGGRQIEELVFKTTGKPSQLRLQADRSFLRRSLNDLSYVRVEVLDQAGNLVPDAVVPISLEVTGAGSLAAAGTANPKDVASFRSNRPNSYHGRCLAIVQARGDAGTITVRADSADLVSATLRLTVS